MSEPAFEPLREPWFSRGKPHLPREVFFCFFGFAGALGVFVATSGFGLFGDTCFSFAFGRLP